MNLCLILLTLTVGFSLIVGQRNTEFLNEDPDGAGIPSCRKCTHEFRKLEKHAQDLWMEIINSGGELQDILHLDNLGKIFRKLFSISQKGMDILEKKEHLNAEEKHEVVVEYLKMFKHYEEMWNELTNVQQKYLQHYYDAGLTQEKRDEEVQNFYQTIGSILGYQAYEIHELSEDNAILWKEERNELPILTGFNVTGKSEL